MRIIKQLLVSLSIVVIMAMGGCGSTQTVTYEPYTYDGFKNIYPAVYYAIKGMPGILSKNSSRTVHNLDDVTIDGIQLMEGLRVVEFSLRISNEDNVISYRFSNFKSRSITNEDWIKTTGFKQDGNYLRFGVYFNTEIPKVLENDDLYYQMLKEVLVSLGSTEAEAAAEAERLREEEAAYR